VTQQMLAVDGASSVQGSGTPPVVVAGGILAQPTNSGHFVRDAFSVVPEARLNVGYQITPWMQARVGYTFVYWSSVIRPGPQIDRLVNPAQIPFDPTYGTPGGLARPETLLHPGDFWAQGLNVGLHFNF